MSDTKLHHQRDGESVTSAQLWETIGELASGASVAIDQDRHGFSYVLVRHLAQPDNEVFQVLMHRAGADQC